MTPLAYFDPDRLAYRVRFRSPRMDTRRNVPRKLYEYERIPYNAPTKRGLAIAQEWAANEARRMEQASAPNAVRSEELTLAQLYELYSVRNPNQVSDKTINRNDELAANLVAFFDCAPSQIDFDRATEYRNQRTARNRTIKNELAFLKQLLTWGYQSRRVTGMAELNLLALPKVRKQESRGIALTKEEIKEILAYKLDHGTATFRRLISFGISTMHRLTPLMAYRLEWVDRPRVWQDVPAWAMKGRRPLSAPLSGWALSCLGPGASGLAFGNFHQRPSKWPRRSVLRLVRETGVRHFSAHDLRRTGMSILHNAGVSKLAIQALAGHAGGDVTDDYVRVDDRVLREACGVFDAFWAGTGRVQLVVSD